MTEVNKNKVRTDEAWRHLYTRLDKDSLLVEVGEEVIRRRLFLKWGTVVAAMLTGVVCLMSVWWLMPGNDTKNLNLVIQENREKSTLVTTLEDGSIVYLGQESVLQYPEHFATDKREVNLHGEAFFDVAKKHEQTFLIETEKVQIEVLGTAFNVRSNEEVPFSLSVRRGKVKVSLKQGGYSVFVNAGETVTLQSQQLQLSETSRGDESGVYTKNIRFKDESLEDILRVVNAENSALQIQTGSLDLGKRKLTIEFLDNSPDTVAELICWALNLKYTREGDKLILSER
ncbi:FecR family protein [Bacteroides nordii]|jgi:ferric-dicitrate binding protein FerR (iron transport regulator)|uniref:FecR family protein n=1 Tax=Bacteroides nordii TaxID=291645 RepID=UPI00189C9FE5|nr:FecR domain-containing protein [Bacteroides nordii]MBD9110608.1 FecR family protein [Bacteroides nordii]MCE8466277.1 FecR domain-containing protein [Bacteroides nordii]UYU47599.1 FecR domain-containing protein [Bacteroides nordii]